MNLMHSIYPLVHSFILLQSKIDILCVHLTMFVRSLTMRTFNIFIYTCCVRNRAFRAWNAIITANWFPFLKLSMVSSLTILSARRMRCCLNKKVSFYFLLTSLFLLISNQISRCLELRCNYRLIISHLAFFQVMIDLPRVTYELFHKYLRILPSPPMITQSHLGT